MPLWHSIAAMMASSAARQNILHFLDENSSPVSTAVRNRGIPARSAGRWGVSLLRSLIRKWISFPSVSFGDPGNSAGFRQNGRSPRRDGQRWLKGHRARARNASWLPRSVSRRLGDGAIAGASDRDRPARSVPGTRRNTWLQHWLPITRRHSSCFSDPATGDRAEHRNPAFSRRRRHTGDGRLSST